MFSTHLLISGILAILTVPSRLAESVAAHRPITRSMHSFELRNGAMHAATNSVSHMEDHSYWAGAVYDSFTANPFTAVTGMLTVPTFSESTTRNNEYSAPAWVGIDGAACGGTIKTGIDPWCRYLDYILFSLSTGDAAPLTVRVTSPMSRTAVIENTTRGQNVTEELTESHRLCGESADWIVGYEQLVPLANFGTTNASSVTLPNIGQEAEVLTDVLVDGNSVIIKYVEGSDAQEQSYEAVGFPEVPRG